MTVHDLKRARLARQYLLEKCDPLQAASGLCGVQAQYLSAAKHALLIRSGSSCTDGLIKSWTLRGTMHLFPEADLPLYFRRCGDPDEVIRTDWYRFALRRGIAQDAAREQHFARLITSAVAQGVQSREELRRLCRDGGMTEKEETGLFHSWGGIIAELAQCGVLCFLVQEEKAYRLLPDFTPMEEKAAELELARRYFTHYGPASLQDAAYFFHVPQTKVKQWLKELCPESTAIDGQVYYWLSAPDAAGPVPACLLLAGFDPLMLGCRKENNPFLPQEHLRGIFTLQGIVHPAVLLDGRVAGRWTHRDGKLTLTMFEPVSHQQRSSILDRAESLWTLKKVEWC